MPQMIPGLDDSLTVALFGLGTAIFVIAMRIFYKGLKLKKVKEPKSDQI